MALPDLITVERFRQMPDDGRAYELHHGDVVAVTRPKAKHYHLQRQLVRLLESRLAGFGQAGMEFPYRPVAEFDLRVAGVAVLSQSRYDRIDPEDNLHGAPQLVVEIKSPSNTDRPLRELASWRWPTAPSRSPQWVERGIRFDTSNPSGCFRRGRIAGR